MLNEAVIASELDNHWYLFTETNSSNAAWAFDRFRIYGTSKYVEIGIFKESQITSRTRIGSGAVFSVSGVLALPPQRFSSTGGFEHDFTFDLSFNTGGEKLLVCIRYLNTGANPRQVYAYPSGYGGTRGKNAEITTWYFDVLNPFMDGGDLGRVRFENQPFSSAVGVDSFDYTASIQAQEFRINGSGVNTTTIDHIIVSIESSGTSNGTLVYTGATPSFSSRAAYDALKARTWNIIGAEPPTT